MRRIGILIAFTLISTQVFGQAWSRLQGHGYVQAGYSIITYNALYAGEIDNLDQIPLPREVMDQTIPVYGEYGVTDKLTLSLELPVKWVKTGDPNQEFFDAMQDSSLGLIALPDKGELLGLGNIRLSGIYNIWKKDYWSATAKLRIEANTGAYDDKSGLRTGFDAWTFSPFLAIGHGRSLWFAAAETGINFRTNNYSTQSYTTAYGGINFLKNIFLFMGGLELQRNIGGDGTHDDGNSVFTGLYIDNIEFLAWYFKLSAKPWKDFRIWLATGRGFGNLVAKAPSFSVTLSKEW